MVFGLVMEPKGGSRLPGSTLGQKWPKVGHFSFMYLESQGRWHSASAAQDQSRPGRWIFCGAEELPRLKGVDYSYYIATIFLGFPVWGPQSTPFKRGDLGSSSATCALSWVVAALGQSHRLRYLCISFFSNLIRSAKNSPNAEGSAKRPQLPQCLVILVSFRGLLSRCVLRDYLHIQSSQ